MKEVEKMEKEKLYEYKTIHGKKKVVFLIDQEGELLIFSDLYGKKLRFKKDSVEKFSEYQYKKGEKTLFNKIMKKVKKLHIDEKKEEGLRNSNIDLKLDIIRQMQEYEENKNEFSVASVRKLLQEINITFVYVNDKQGEEEIAFSYYKEIVKYASEEDYPFLYTEYDGSMHCRHNEVNEYLEITVKNYYKEKIERAAKKNSLLLAFVESVSLGDKNTLNAKFDVNIKPKNKIDFKKFKEFVKEISFMSEFDSEKDIYVKKKKVV